MTRRAPNNRIETETAPDPLAARIRGLFADTARGLFRRPGAPLALVAALLILWQNYGYPFFYQIVLEPRIGAWRYAAIAPSLYWFATNVVMLLVTPLVVARVAWKMGPRDLGLGAGDRRLGLMVVAIGYLIMIPILAVVSTWPEFRESYPLDRDALGSNELFLVYESGYASFFIGWEFFFRGFLLFALEPVTGAPGAIAAQMVPFALLHVGKPIAEALGSVIAGVFLGVLAWRTRSIWYGVALHAAVALTMDVIAWVRAGSAG